LHVLPPDSSRRARSESARFVGRRTAAVTLAILLATCVAGAASGSFVGGAAPGVVRLRAPNLTPLRVARAATTQLVRVLARPIRWRQSRAIGLPYAGRLVRGVRLPSEGRDFFTWEAPLRHSPNRPWRRYGTGRLVRLILRVASRYRAAHPHAPRVTVGDLSRPDGGEFGPRFGGMGHRSHQNGLDVDIYYPRRDRRERAPRTVRQIDRRLAQDLVDRFVAAGAQFVFVGTGTRLSGPPGVVQAIAHHDDHMHVRIAARD
jgi:murein endopeptidase